MHTILQSVNARPIGNEDQRSSPAETRLPAIPGRLQRLRRHAGRARPVAGRQCKDQGEAASLSVLDVWAGSHQCDQIGQFFDPLGHF